ncbi:uncharacterized protein [Spinacia oleracea]|uniref:Reverse transcriptase domain-containing protein n=1 Tax=Spinacia oleracea TaxID=3562 RepID=A0ABM3RR89_SPIOL|nr:uncharacterized protein LOC130471834 [Spinacia oleracea]
MLNKIGFNSIEAESLRSHKELLQIQQEMHRQPGDSYLDTSKKVAGYAYKVAHQCYLPFLYQKTKVQWLELGDENSRVFHQSIKQRRKTNQIHSIQTSEGVWVKTPDEVQNAFTQFYDSLFWSIMTNRRQKKAPGLDGFSSHFFKATWSIVSTNICAAISDFSITSKILKEVNVTSITLVPKVTVPASVGDFRPIACCPILYKCISKLLCSKLSDILPDIITHTQGAFVST